MEFLTLVYLTALIVLVFLRFKAYYSLEKWLFVVAYLGLLFLMNMKLDHLMGMIRTTQEYNRSIGITSVTNDWLYGFAKFYSEYDPIIKFLFFMLLIELITFFVFFIYKNLKDKVKIKLIIKVFVISWLANVIVFVVLPASVYPIFGFINSVQENSIVNINDYFFNSIIIGYMAPAYFLGIESDYLLNYGFRDISLVYFCMHAAPWYLLCFLMAFFSTFVAIKNNKFNSPSLKNLFFVGGYHGVWRNFFNLPWRGKFILAFFVVCVFLISVSILLGALFASIIVFFMYGLIIVPILIILFLFFVIKKSRK